MTCFANEIAGKEFRDVFQQVGLTEDDIGRYMVSTESLPPVEQKILAVADPQGRLGALTKQAERFLTHVDTKEILHADQRERTILGLKEMLTPERAEELHVIADRYQQIYHDKKQKMYAYNRRAEGIGERDRPVRSIWSYKEAATVFFGNVRGNLNV